MVKNHFSNAAYLFHPAQMAATFKSSGHKYIYHFIRIAFSYKSSGDANDVGIIMFSYKLGYFLTPANGGSDIRMFVSGDSHPIGSAA